MLSRPASGGSFQFELSGQSNLVYLIESSVDLLRWLPVQTNFDFRAVRTINATSPEPARYFRARALHAPFRFALLSRSTIDPTGNNLRSDSFNSADPNFSTDGRYDPTKRKDRGDVAVSSGLTNSLNIGNVEILGRLWTSPGVSSSGIGPQGRVGSLAWHSAAYGIEPGWWLANLYASAPVANLPTNMAPVSPRPGPGVVNGQYYQYVLGNGDYALEALSLSGSNKVAVTGRARLFVPGEIRITEEASVVFWPDLARLELYAGGANALLGGRIVPQRPAQFVYYGMARNTNVIVPGPITAAIYAPNATCEIGSGATAIDFTGACVARSIVLAGHVAMHFDERLIWIGPYY